MGLVSFSSTIVTGVDMMKDWVMKSRIEQKQRAPDTCFEAKLGMPGLKQSWRLHTWLEKPRSLRGVSPHHYGPAHGPDRPVHLLPDTQMPAELCNCIEEELHGSFTLTIYEPEEFQLGPILHPKKLESITTQWQMIISI